MLDVVLYAKDKWLAQGGLISLDQAALLHHLLVVSLQLDGHLLEQLAHKQYWAKNQSIVIPMTYRRRGLLHLRSLSLCWGQTQAILSAAVNCRHLGWVSIGL